MRGLFTHFFLGRALRAAATAAIPSALCALRSAFREVLTQQRIGVLVGAALPRVFRIAEAGLDYSIELETCMLRHFGSLTPCE
jgi:hypothetical protein